MPAVGAKIEYETGKNKKSTINIVMQEYEVTENSRFGEHGQRILSVQQKKKAELNISFYIFTYSASILKKDGSFKEEEIKDARTEVSKISKLNDEIAELHRQPVCRIIWGDEQFSGILKELEYRYTMYSHDGTPIQANFKAKFQENIDIESALQNDNTPQSPDRTKYRPLYERTQLFQMAYQEYNDPEKWRVIAEANNISDPLDVITGSMLVLPPL